MQLNYDLMFFIPKAKLEVVWDRLQVPPKDRVDMTIVYSNPSLTSQLMEVTCTHVTSSTCNQVTYSSLLYLHVQDTPLFKQMIVTDEWK